LLGWRQLDVEFAPARLNLDRLVRIAEARLLGDGGTLERDRVVTDQRCHLVGAIVVDLAGALRGLTNCVRVYTDPRGPRSEPLDVASAGVVDDAMVVTIDGALYMHESGLPMEPGHTAMPYAAVAPERMSWAEWSRRHPDTEVFVAAKR
jgi:hypothetical protein